ncbi:MAG: hypothetical protein Q8R22_10115 [Flavobacterium sp.]|uniref:hypothetical protein n=1 Tax=Flavobacterium TaxID=237 RepID=UPI0024A7BC0F|nr:MULTISPECIES: hypothetical protein [Flavobacterium]MDI5886451.1 hypothetical protein [Flavobacterium yafengii]MDP3681173.1 hypothetical protein [Flavobacterium sp.]
MKKTKNIFWVLSIFLLTLYSCSNDNDDSLKLLKKVVETSENGTSETTVYTYNGTEIVSIDGVQKRSDFTYTDGLITKTVILNKTNQLSETIEYSYLVGKLVEVESLGNYRINYIHNTDKTVSYERFRISGNQQVKEFHGTLYFENENLIKNERILDTMPVGITSSESITFDYDAKNNPLYNVLGYKNLLDHMETISSNNSLINTVIATTTNGDQVLSVANFYKSSFKYDSENYPTERVSETAILANGNTGYLKTQYFY